MLNLLILSGGLILIAFALYRQHPVIIAITVGMHAVACYPFLPAPARPLMFVVAIVAIAWLVARWRQVSRPVFVAFVAASNAMAWCLTFGPFLPQWFEIQRLATEYPQVRIDSRLSYERQAGFSVPGTVPENRDLELTSLINYEFADRYWSLFALEELHDDFFEAFAAQDGFGGERMTFEPPQTELIELPAEPGPLSIAFDISPVTSASSGTPAPLKLEPSVLFHREQVLNFANSRGFGYPVDGKYVVEDYPYGPTSGMYMLRGVTRVRGFQPHAFRQLPKGSPDGIHWQITRLELVSLLKHDPPAVYVSEHLPRMQELSAADAPTRPLDSFESASMRRLLDGETVVAEQNLNRIRMLGGVRATIQCTQCHSVGEGHLLGAFSYEFLRKQLLPPRNDEPSHSPVI